jgi:hypothetical protein
MTTYADMFMYQLTRSPGEVTYGYTAWSAASFSHLLLTDTGVVQCLAWDATTHTWRTFFQASMDSRIRVGRGPGIGRNQRSSDAVSTRQTSSACRTLADVAAASVKTRRKTLATTSLHQCRSFVEGFRMGTVQTGNNRNRESEKCGDPGDFGMN